MKQSPSDSQDRPEEGAGPRVPRWVGFALGFLLLYISVYVGLSRWSAYLVRSVGGQGFYYVPVPIDVLVRSETLQSLDLVLSGVFYPLERFDSRVLGNPGHASMPLMAVEK